MCDDANRRLLEEIWHAGVARVVGYQCVKDAIHLSPSFKVTHIVSVGKAGSSMARAALDVFGVDLPCLIVTKYEHGEAELKNYPNLKLIESAHPVPDENSLLAGEALLNFVSELDDDAHLLVLASGGASSLAEALIDGHSLSDLKNLNQEMLSAGLDIHAMNKKRKAISKIKDGKLLQSFAGNSVVSFLISDVEGDDSLVIGSGIGSTSKVGDATQIQEYIIASNKIAREACVQKAQSHDLNIICNEESLYGDVFDIAREKANIVKSGAKGLYIFGGEPVIQLPENPGMGGRNQALATAMAREMRDAQNVSILVAGTDGSDGPTQYAGGYVSGACWQKTPDGQAALDKADSGNWLKRANGLFKTGATGTNVMDIMLVLKS